MKSIALLFLLAIPALAGCSNHSNPPKGPPCGNDYTLGCDNNPDAQYFLKTYGVHQFTNSTYFFRSLSMRDALVAWQEEAQPYDYAGFKGFSTNDGSFYTFAHNQSLASGYPKYYGSKLFYTETPFKGGPRGVGKADFYNTSFYVGDLRDNQRRQVPFALHGTFKGEGFDGKWALLTNQRFEEKVEDDFLALNTETGHVITLYQGGKPFDPSGYSTPVLAQAVNHGHAYYALDLTRDNGTTHSLLVDYDLENGTQHNLAAYPNAWIESGEISASNKYVSALVDSRLYIYDTEGRLVFANQTLPLVFHPKLGGDWALYSEVQTNPPRQHMTALHIPTGRTFDFMEHAPNTFGQVDWDTDGHQAVIEVGITDKGDLFQYQSTELYWMDLPKVT